MRKVGTVRSANAPRGKTIWNRFIADALRESWRRQDKLRRQCRRKPSHQHIHALRIETRRLLALVTLASAIGRIPTGKIRRRLNHQLRATAKPRESHVQTRTLKNLMPEHPELRALCQFLKKRERRANKDVDKKITRRKLAKHLGQLIRTVDESAETPFAGATVNQAWRDALSQLADATAAGGSSPDELHRARLAVKNVRYLAELFQSTLPGSSRRWIATLRRRQQLLGKIHDLDQLHRRLDRYLGKRKSKRRALQSVEIRFARQRQRLCQQYRAIRLPRPPPKLSVGSTRGPRRRR